MINLVNGGIQHSNLFIHLPIFDEIYCEGFFEGRIRKYKAIREDQPCQIFALTIIRKDEDVIWDALEDLLRRAVTQAAYASQGVYIFDLLTVDIHNEVKTFNVNELSETIVNHTRKLTPGAIRLVKYSSVYGLLQKFNHENWGKIALKTSVEVFKDQPIFLDLLFKQLIKNFQFNHDPVVFLLHDLSQQPIFDPQNSEQQERLRKLLEKQLAHTIDFPPEVYIEDRNGVRELLSGLAI